MMPARWARGATPRIAAGVLVLALGGTLSGCAGGYLPAAAPPVLAPTVIPQPAAAPQAAEPAEAGDPCPYLSNEEVAALAGDQRTQLVGASNTCGFNIGGQFNYQIDVMSNDGDRFDADKATFFKDATVVNGVGDEAFFRNGTAITVLGARKGNSYFTVTLVPAVADPNVGPGAPVAAADTAADAAALVAKVDTDGDGVVDADTDGDGQIDPDAPQKAVAAADTNGDGLVDAAAAAAVAAEKPGGGAAANTNNAKNKNAKNAAPAPVTDIDAAKARMTDVAKAVADNL